MGEKLTYKKVFLFWGPLALTWLMMAVEQPFLIGVIARLGDAKYNLAAFGIAYSFALIIEAPVIMLMSASVALVRNRESYIQLKKFTDILNIGVTCIQLLLLIPPVFYWIVGDVMGVPDNVVKLTHIALLLLLPWAAAIGYRRFYQGILIRHNLTQRVTYGTIVRLSAIAVVGLVLYNFDIAGAYVAAAAGSLAVISEAIATRLMAAKTVKTLLCVDKDCIGIENGNSDSEEAGKAKKVIPDFSLKSITRFYTPLALTSLLSLGVHPFVTFFLGKSYMAIESLAVLPVVSSLVFIFRSLGLSYQEVNIALIGDNKQNYKILKNFALILGIVVTVGISVLAFTPLADIWFINVSGLTDELAAMSYLPLKIMILMPALTVLLNFQRSSLVVNGTTGPISKATAIELVTIIVVLFICVVTFNMVGVVAATIAFMIGKFLSNVYLTPKQVKAVKSWKKQS